MLNAVKELFLYLVQAASDEHLHTSFASPGSISFACEGHALSRHLCRRYDADKKIISGTGALYALLAIWGLMLPLTAGTRPVIGGMSSSGYPWRS